MADVAADLGGGHVFSDGSQIAKLINSLSVTPPQVLTIFTRREKYTKFEKITE